VTPGPVVPAREQLAELLLEVHRPADALTEFKADLVLAPGRRDALQGAAMAAQEAGDSRAEGQYRALLQSQSAGR